MSLHDDDVFARCPSCGDELAYDLLDDACDECLGEMHGPDEVHGRGRVEGDEPEHDGCFEEPP